MLFIIVSVFNYKELIVNNVYYLHFKSYILSIEISDEINCFDEVTNVWTQLVVACKEGIEPECNMYLMTYLRSLLKK